MVNLIENSAQSIIITVFIISGDLCFLVFETGLFHLHYEERLLRRRFQSERQELTCPGGAPGYFILIGDKAPPATDDRSEDARTLN